MLETNLWQVDKFRFSTLDFAFLQHLYQLHYSPNSKYNGLRGMPSTKYYEGASKKIPAIFPRSWQRTIPLVLLTNTFKSGFPYLVANLLVRVHVISSIRFILDESLLYGFILGKRMFCRSRDRFLFIGYVCGSPSLSMEKTKVGASAQGLKPHVIAWVERFNFICNVKKIQIELNL